MPANVSSMFSVRETPWHRLGVVIEEALLSEEAIKMAGLDWSVERKPIYVDGGSPIPGYVANVRNDTGKVLGVVGQGYSPVQNAEAFRFMDEIAGNGRLLHYHTAGALDGGKRVWMLAKVDNLIEPVPGDTVQPYLLLSNGHDGTHGLHVAWTSVRVVCQNTLNLALGTTRNKISLRHTGDINNRIHEAQRVLGLTNQVVEETRERFDRLRLKKVGSDLLNSFLEELIPDPESGNNGKAETARREILSMYLGGAPGADLPGVGGTAWGVLNAVTAYTTHARSTRTSDESLREEKRLKSIWFGTGDALNQRAVKLLEDA